MNDEEFKLTINVDALIKISSSIDYRINNEKLYMKLKITIHSPYSVNKVNTNVSYHCLLLPIFSLRYPN